LTTTPLSTMTKSQNNSTSRRKRESKLEKYSLDELSQLFFFPQDFAAKMLQVSTSTLKRRFNELSKYGALVQRTNSQSHPPLQIVCNTPSMCANCFCSTRAQSAVLVFTLEWLLHSCAFRFELSATCHPVHARPADFPRCTSPLAFVRNSATHLFVWPCVFLAGCVPFVSVATLSIGSTQNRGRSEAASKMALFQRLVCIFFTTNTLIPRFSAHRQGQECSLFRKPQTTNRVRAQ